jgi:hypothetical protein
MEMINFYNKRSGVEGVSHGLPISSLVGDPKNVKIESNDSSDLKNKKLDASSSAGGMGNKILKVDDIAKPIVYDELNSRIEFSKKIKSYVEKYSQLKINNETKEAAIENRKYQDQIAALEAECSGLIPLDTLMRDNKRQPLRCQYES